MSNVKFKALNQPRMRPIKYEMAKRKEKWKSLYDPVEKLLSTPPEAKFSVVQKLVSNATYDDLASMLDLPHLDVEPGWSTSVETIIPYIPPDIISEPASNDDEIIHKKTRTSTSISGSLSGSSSSLYESIAKTILSVRQSVSQHEIKSETTKEEVTETTRDYDDSSSFVELEKKSEFDLRMMLRHKAILRFLSLPEDEAASWRVRDAKDVSDMSQMTLEEKGDYLINKIAVDFCNWIKELGGDEKSFVSEEIVKELFQIGMDNPATRAICMKTKEKRILYHKLAQFLHMSNKSFHEVLLKHLNWDAMVEKKPSQLIAFGKCLPKDMRFKTPQNNTVETWLEWNKLPAEQLSFADVYKDIKDLRSTKEYCKWMRAHPEHKRPQYLVDQRMFEEKLSEPRIGSRRHTNLKVKTKPY